MRISDWSSDVCSSDLIDLQTARLHVGGWTLDHLKLNATRPQPEHWRVRLDSHQAAGSLAWQEASGAIAGQVTARPAHLALGEKVAKEALHEELVESGDD